MPKPGNFDGRQIAFVIDAAGDVVDGRIIVVIIIVVVAVA